VPGYSIMLLLHRFSRPY